MSERDNSHLKIEPTEEERLKASEHRFRSLVRHGSDLMVILDSSANYIYVADPTKRVLGYNAGFFIGKNAIDYIHPDDAPLVMAAINKLAPQADIELPPYRFKAANGEWRWMESKLTNLIDDPAIGGLVVNSRDITERRRLEAERLFESEKRQRQITHTIVQAQEKERRAIGNELHDNVNQMLTTVKLYLVMARDNAGTRDDLLPKAIDYIQECIDEIRKLTNRLVTSHQQDIDLNEALKDLIDSIALTGTLQLNFHPVDMKNLEISEEVRLAVYRIIQEQLTNIIRHANATVVDIALFAEDNILHLAIIDNGQGFDMNQKRKGVGLTNMYNRAEAVNGSVRINSEPGSGTVLEAHFPVKIL